MTITLGILFMSIVQIISMTMLICIYKKQNGEYYVSPAVVGFKTCLCIIGVFILLAVALVTIFAMIGF